MMVGERCFTKRRRSEEGVFEKEAGERLTATASSLSEEGQEREARRSKLRTWMSREMLISEAKCLRLS